MEHPRSPLFDSHVAATGDASTMAALRTEVAHGSFGLAAHSTPTHVHAALRGKGGRGEGRRSKVSCKVLMAIEASPQRAVGRSCGVSGGPRSDR